MDNSEDILIADSVQINRVSIRFCFSMYTGESDLLTSRFDYGPPVAIKPRRHSLSVYRERGHHNWSVNAPNLRNHHSVSHDHQLKYY